MMDSPQQDVNEEKKTCSSISPSQSDASNTVGSTNDRNDATALDRPLKRGDLVRVNWKGPGRLNDHDGDLGRISRAIQSESAMGHPFLYDIELVLGGRINGLQRNNLLYTTAEEEGMTGESRSRRKRKPTTLNEEQAAKPKKQKAKPKRKAPAKKQKKSTATMKASVGKKRSTNDKPKNSVKKTKPSPTDEPSASNALDLYERHRREFERSISRLEKLDQYGYFSGPVPDDFDELYEQQSPRETDVLSQQEMHSSSRDSHHSTGESSSQSPNFPLSPPYNWKIVRKRMEFGRYVFNVESREEKDWLMLMEPYHRSIGHGVGKRRNESFKSNRPKLRLLHTQAIDWDVFRDDVLGMCDAAVARNPEINAGSTGTISHTATRIKDVMEQIYDRTGSRHQTEIKIANDRHRLSKIIEISPNIQPAMQGKWRMTAFPERRYERLKTDVVCAGLSDLDERIASYELRTSLQDGFIGHSYTYDDTGQSEGWMKSVLNEAGERNEQQKAALALASDDGVIKAQVEASMEALIIAVQNRVMSEVGVLEQRELRSANWETAIGLQSNLVTSDNQIGSSEETEVVEQEVWGIDCYTHRNISICLESEFDPATVIVFVEKWLLPAINACPVDLAYSLANAARILEGLPFDAASSLESEGGTTLEQWKSSLLGKALLNKIAASGPYWLKAAAHLLRRACESLGPDFFRVHPKGHGSIVLCPRLEANTLVTFYRGEVYPSWRWGEKMDAIEITQQRKGLKPVLPDFFNMALERPQKDPRGYGLLFVDASRKAGHGSMLSHSCTPSCEVRVAAVNGELTLAMTTLRELSIGDELTFDYNAVTESLNEYQSAVCLCGHSQCRGSFLHFATADCYQQVLNRNAPIAVRMASLIKGCMKKVMSEDDDRILKSHGFNTAAFGAISVNRRKASGLQNEISRLDSMEIVPIWLRTFVADTLRYIEYERRALPIALICNELFTDTAKKNSAAARTEKENEIKVSPEKSSGTSPGATEVDTLTNDDKPIKGARPEPTFFYYARVQRETFVSMLMERGSATDLVGLELKREIQKIAGSQWKELDAEKKLYWRRQAVAEWEKNGGRERARLEEERIARKQAQSSPSASNTAKAAMGGDVCKRETKKSPTQKKSPKGNSKEPDLSDKEESEGVPAKISFKAADAEGASAMEQRIQQLTQILSRVGRVLDRHREKALQQLEVTSSLAIEGVVTSAEALREKVHSPMAIMPDEHVVAWMWNHDDGIVRVLLRLTQDEPCVSPSLRNRLKEIESKYKAFEAFGTPWAQGDKTYEPSTWCPTEARMQLTDALLEFRETLLNELRQMETDLKKQRALTRKEAARKKKNQTRQVDRNEGPADSTEDVETIVRSVIDDLLDAVAERTKQTTNACSPSASPSSTAEATKASQEATDQTPELEVWLQNYNKRFKLQKAADLLLIYARTSTFFCLKPFQPLKSSPIEVYARELGNSVPISAVDAELDSNENDKIQSIGTEVETVKRQKKSRASAVCKPDDTITKVVVDYQGDFVVSQMLQWYNAGIGQKPGLPDMLGCILLPSMAGCWKIDSTQGSNSRTDRPTRYQTHTLPRLIEWFKDPHQRGSPWPDELRKAFIDKVDPIHIPDASSLWLPFGSPILDFLVTGDDFNILDILHTLGSSTSRASMEGSKSAAQSLLSSVDHGRPAQAVSNWVQCENPECLKWRKVPWNVDIDILSAKFVCKDNIWNPSSASCEAPEDEWNETTDAQVDADGSTYVVECPSKSHDVTEKTASKNDCKVADFVLGGRFDVLRTGKQSWSVGVVVKLDLDGDTKRVKFHFPKMQSKHDEWVEIDSPRVAPLQSMTFAPSKKNPQVATVRSALDKEKSRKTTLKAMDNLVTSGSTEKENAKRATSPNSKTRLDRFCGEGKREIGGIVPPSNSVTTGNASESEDPKATTKTEGPKETVSTGQTSSELEAPIKFKNRGSRGSKLDAFDETKAGTAKSQKLDLERKSSQKSRCVVDSKERSIRMSRNGSSENCSEKVVSNAENETLGSRVSNKSPTSNVAAFDNSVSSVVQPKASPQEEKPLHKGSSETLVEEQAPAIPEKSSSENPSGQVVSETQNRTLGSRIPRKSSPSVRPLNKQHSGLAQSKIASLKRKALPKSESVKSSEDVPIISKKSKSEHGRGQVVSRTEDKNLGSRIPRKVSPKKVQSNQLKGQTLLTSFIPSRSSAQVRNERGTSESATTPNTSSRQVPRDWQKQESSRVSSNGAVNRHTKSSRSHNSSASQFTVYRASQPLYPFEPKSPFRGSRHSDQSRPSNVKLDHTGRARSRNKAPYSGAARGLHLDRASFHDSSRGSEPNDQSTHSRSYHRPPLKSESAYHRPQYHQQPYLGCSGGERSPHRDRGGGTSRNELFRRSPSKKFQPAAKVKNSSLFPHSRRDSKNETTKS